MRRNEINHLLLALAATAAAVVIGLWSWNTLAAMLELPAAGFRHSLAVLGMLVVVRGALLAGRGCRRRRPLCPYHRGSSG
jgi:hypothetical protein